jgi:hypothetical protein
LWGAVLLATCVLSSKALAYDYDRGAIDPSASEIPDRIVLTWKGDPATTQAVTWRTDATITEAAAEIVVADASPNFVHHSRRDGAVTEVLDVGEDPVHFHSVNFTALEPSTLYAYRVGSDDIWSEWFHFRTASRGPEPFSFIYFGDAQNNLLSMWSRAIRSAFSDAPHASFMIHAGDLINNANLDRDWAEWFEAGDWIHAMVPGIPTPGNHEYFRSKVDGDRRVSHYWRPQFALPEEPVHEDLLETVYHIDYQGVRIISLNSNEKLKEQVTWLESKLESNPNRWTVVTFHHPVFSSAVGRGNRRVRRYWKPLFDRYRVDLVLQGHDHTYARGRNLPGGTNVRENSSGTVYVVSVSGPKMYSLTPDRWMDRRAENTQLYQIISVEDDTLRFTASTVTGQLYDAFDLVKQKGAPNRLINRVPEGVRERTHRNTLGKD